MELALQGDDVQYESTEPWLHFEFSKDGSHIDILSRLSVMLGGPIIEYNFECREDEIKNTLCDLVRVVEKFPCVHVDS
jgi:murein DD-endopeptidase MepM/ murein hydrolase activator NlpD